MNNNYIETYDRQIMVEINCSDYVRGKQTESTRQQYSLVLKKFFKLRARFPVFINIIIFIHYINFYKKIGAGSSNIKFA